MDTQTENPKASVGAQTTSASFTDQGAGPDAATAEDDFMGVVAGEVDKREAATERKNQQYGATSVDTGTHGAVPYSQRGIAGSSTDNRGGGGIIATAPERIDERMDRRYYPTARNGKSSKVKGPMGKTEVPKRRMTKKTTPPAPVVRGRKGALADLEDTNPKGKTAKLTKKPKGEMVISAPTAKAAPAPKATPAPKAAATPATPALTIPIPIPKAKAKAAPKAKAAASSSASASAPVKKNITKVKAPPPPIPPVNKNITKTKAPSTMGIQLLREYFEDANNKGKIPKTTFTEYSALFAKWKSGGDKKAALKEMQQLYKTIYKRYI